MSGPPLKPGLCCPACGQTVLMVCHEWSPSDDRATFEYHHHADAEKDRRGEPPAPCVVVMSLAQGQARSALESAPDDADDRPQQDKG